MVSSPPARAGVANAKTGRKYGDATQHAPSEKLRLLKSVTVKLTAAPVAGAADECRRRRATTLTCRTSSRDPGMVRGHSMETRRHLRASMRLRRLPIPAGRVCGPSICYCAPQTHRCSSLTAHKARANASLTGAPISSWVERAPGSGGQRHVSVQGNRSRRGGAVGGHDELWGGAGDQAGDRGNPEGD